MSLKDEVDNILMKDPAARSRAEVVLCYPGFHAVCMYRVAHKFWVTKVPTMRLIARCISQFSRFLTGIEIHPGAKIGNRLFIDHGLGVVIGETTEVGDDCVLYQGVTLGAQAAARMGALSRDTKRHPTLGNSVVVGSGAQILGGFTVGNNVQIASGSILLKEVSDDCIVVGVPGRVIYREGVRVSDPVPDIEAEAIKCLNDKLSKIENRLERLQSVPMFEPTETGVRRPSMQSTTQIKQETIVVATSDAVDIFLHGAGI